MKRDSVFGRHCLPHDAGAEVSKRFGDVEFCLTYVKRNVGILAVNFIAYECGCYDSRFHVRKHKHKHGSKSHNAVCVGLFGLYLSFCVVCGRFIGFRGCGLDIDVCWVCESELEG